MDCHPDVRADRPGLHQGLPVPLTAPGLKKSIKNPLMERVLTILATVA
jgi:hypothetical protein